MEPLPIDAVIPELLRALAVAPAVVLSAPPGSGKSTRIPPAVLRSVPGMVYLLQPRRIAAKALARRIAEENRWRLGGEIGYRVRFERQGTATTRLWVMTEGSLTRQLLSDPYLEGVSAIILDEFHERSLHLDLALAYLLELTRSLRPDLKLVVMSATLESAPLATYLGSADQGPAPTIDAPGRLHAVAISHASHAAADLGRPLADRVAWAVSAALREPDAGDVLVFLPGAGEIRACAQALAAVPAEIIALHGQLPPEEQERALTPGSGPRVVLATNVAETSLTIPGVRTVIDSGLVRVQRFDPHSGVEELALEPISRSSATQRAGRAGRTAAGRCVRLWSPLAERQMEASTTPEVRRLDLAPTLLVLKRLGYRAVHAFPWFETPDAPRLAHAERLLQMLGAGEAGEALSAVGERLAGLPLHPRLGRLLVDAAAARALRLGATLCALSAERDLRARRQGDAAPAEPAAADALERLELLAQAEQGRHQGYLRQVGIDPSASQQVVRAREEILAAWHAGNPGWSVPRQEPEATPALLARLLLAAFPDRLARRSAADPNRATMVGNVALEIDRGSALFADRASRSSLLVATEVQRLERHGRSVVVLRQGVDIDEALLEQVVPSALSRERALIYDRQAGRVVAQSRWMYRDLCIREASGEISDMAAASHLLAESLAPEAAALIAEDAAASAWLRRLAWLAAVRPDLDLPAIDLPAQARVLADCCAGCTTRAEVAAKPKVAWLQSLLTPLQARQVEELAPERVRVPTGNAITLDYSAATREQPPVLAVRLQELFGLARTPRIAGEIAVLLHLLAPNYRVEQVTRDLASFWSSTYPQVRKDLRGRYPKHAWPDDPLTAVPVAKGRPQQH